MTDDDWSNSLDDVQVRFPAHSRIAIVQLVLQTLVVLLRKLLLCMYVYLNG